MFFGWKVVATAFAVATFAWSFGFYGPAVFLNTLHQQHGWSVSVISTAITVHYLVSAILTARLRSFHRRFGIATITRFGITALALGAVGWSLASSPWHLFAAALITGAGWSATNAAAINAMVAPWFNRQRALALSHAFTGSSVGGVVFTPLWVALIARFGFTEAAMLMAALTLAVLWPLIGRYLAAPAATMGLHPDGDTDVAATASAIGSGASLRFAVLLRDRRFITISAAFALGLFAQIPCPQALPQGRPVEARQHDAEASLQRHLSEHLRRGYARGEDGAGHACLALAELARHTGLEQLQHLTGRPGVDVRHGAFADLLPQESLHRPSARRSRDFRPIVRCSLPFGHEPVSFRARSGCAERPGR